MNKSSSYTPFEKCYQKKRAFVSKSSRSAGNPEPVLSNSRLSLARRLFVILFPLHIHSTSNPASGLRDYCA